jgi:hypothetical protein
VRYVPNWTATVGHWLGFPAVWLEPEPVAEGTARRVSDRGVLAHFLDLARPGTTVRGLADFTTRHGWLPLELSGRRTRMPGSSRVTVLAPPDEATKEDVPRRGLVEEALTHAVVPAHDASGGPVHPLVVYRRYAQVADYILRGSRALAEYEHRRERTRWAAVLDGSAGGPEPERLLEARKAASWLGAPLRSLESLRKSRASDPADTDRHGIEFCLHWWFEHRSLRITPTWHDRDLQLTVVSDDLWGVLALELGRTVAGGHYAFCRKCGSFYLRVASGGPRGGRPALLCSTCYTVDEGRRIAARRAYERRRSNE